jgi:hypothetical protein
MSQDTILSFLSSIEEFNTANRHYKDILTTWNMNICRLVTENSKILPSAFPLPFFIPITPLEAHTDRVLISCSIDSLTHIFVYPYDLYYKNDRGYLPIQVKGMAIHSLTFKTKNDKSLYIPPHDFTSILEFYGHPSSKENT